MAGLHCMARGVRDKRTKDSQPSLGPFPGWVLGGCTAVLWAENTPRTNNPVPLWWISVTFSSLTFLSLMSPSPHLSQKYPCCSLMLISRVGLLECFLPLERNETPPKISGKGDLVHEIRTGTGGLCMLSPCQHKSRLPGRSTSSGSVH